MSLRDKSVVVTGGSRGVVDRGATALALGLKGDTGITMLEEEVA
jgi:NAD(P)-dependent dehydrogenase (short-subunit alcohol dehydrogenase family)